MAHASAQKLSATDNRKKIPKMEQLFDDLSAQQCQFRLVQEVANPKMNLKVHLGPKVGIPVTRCLGLVPGAPGSFFGHYPGTIRWPLTTGH
jgi:hypothetical protein